MNRLDSGRFTLLSSDENYIIVKIMGGIPDDLSYDELRYLASFYTHGKFLVSGAKILKRGTVVSGSRIPRANDEDMLRINLLRLPYNLPEDQYQRMLAKEEATGVEVE